MKAKFFYKFTLLAIISLAYIFGEMKVTFVGGVAYIERDNNKIKIHEGDRIKSDDVIITGSKSLVILKHSDGTVFKLLSNSEVKADFYINSKKKTSGEFKLLKGKLSYLVNSLFKDSDSEIKIIDQNRVASTRG